MWRALPVNLVRASVLISAACLAQENTQAPDNPESIAALKGIGANLETDDRGRVVKVSALGRSFNDEMVRHLHGLQGLESLYLGDDPKITVRGFESLAQLPHLRSLCIYIDSLSSVELGSLRKAPKLEELQIASVKINDHGMAELGRCVHLKLLMVGGSEITDAGVEHLAALPELEWVNLYTPSVTDRSLAILARIAKLKVLVMDGTPISDAGLVRLKSCERLETLSLCGTRITDIGLANLIDLPQLQTFYLRKTQVTDAGLEALKRAPKLRNLQLEGTRVSEAGALNFEKDIAGSRTDIGTGFYFNKFLAHYERIPYTARPSALSVDEARKVRDDPKLRQTWVRVPSDAFRDSPRLQFIFPEGGTTYLVRTVPHWEPQDEKTVGPFDLNRSYKAPATEGQK